MREGSSGELDHSTDQQLHSCCQGVLRRERTPHLSTRFWVIPIDRYVCYDGRIVQCDGFVWFWVNKAFYTVIIHSSFWSTEGSEHNCLSSVFHLRYFLLNHWLFTVVRNCAYFLCGHMALQRNCSFHLRFESHETMVETHSGTVYKGMPTYTLQNITVSSVNTAVTGRCCVEGEAGHHAPEMSSDAHSYFVATN